jgi:hypothetical protein
LPDGLSWSGTGSVGPTVITSAANRIGSGTGARFYAGNGRNRLGGKLGVSFSTPQPELWVRWYIRYDPDFSWGSEDGSPTSSPIWDKNIYSFTSNDLHYTEWRGGYIRIGVSGTDLKSFDGFGWNNIIGAANGGWVCMEQYMKMNTGGENGAARIWMNGDLALEDLSVNFGGSNGWRTITFENNQGYPIGAPPEGYTVDYDDMVIYNTPPPNRDANNNPYIGCL